MNTNQLDVATLPLHDAWKLFMLQKGIQNTQEYRKARFGININFDINDALIGNIKIKAKSQEAIINRWKYNLEDYNTELENRERIIKEYLIEQLEPERLVTYAKKRNNSEEPQDG